MRKTKNIFLLILSIMLPASSVSAQTVANPAYYVSEKFSSYVGSVPWEEVFIHTDRDQYIAGENIWMNAYLTDRNTSGLSLHSRIIYLELLDPANRLLSQKKILLDKGMNPANIKLSDTLKSGTYTLRAYTSWMRNFLPGNCFSKEIDIYNSQLPGQFIRSKRNSEQTITADEPGQNGQLFLMKLHFSESGNLEMVITANGAVDYRENELFCLFARSGSRILHASNEKLSEGKIETVISHEELKTGLICVTLFDFRYKPVCEKYIYLKPDNSLSLSSEPEVKYGKRKRVSLSFNTGLKEDELTDAALSVSVTPLIPESREWDFSQYIILGTEFGEAPVMKLNGRRPEDLPVEELESLLESIKSRWIIWDRIFSGRDYRFRYPVESDEHFLYGTLMETDTWTALKDQVVIMSFPGETALFQYAVTDTAGNFSLAVPVDEYEKDLVIQPDDLYRFKGIKLRSQFLYNLPEAEIVKDTSASLIPAHILKWSMNYRVSSVYGTPFAEKGTEISGVPVIPKRFYGKPDFELLLDDYMELPLMEEVFFELVPRVRLRNWNSVCDISILDQAGNKLYTEASTLMIDGVIIRDPTKVGNLDPALVRKIDVIWGIYMVDAYQFYGIVNLITRTADFSAVPLSDKALRMTYRISDPPGEFICPEYPTTETLRSRIPDLRNTLYWNPSIKTGTDGNATLEFWTSDYASEYEINIQGIGSNGEAVSLRRVITVE